MSQQIDTRKITPNEFYKFEYFSKIRKGWVELKKTDSPVLLKKQGYELRYKKLYIYTE